MGGVLRAESRIALPDALVVATSRLRGASCIVTQDKELARLQSVLDVKSPRELD